MPRVRVRRATDRRRRLARTRAITAGAAVACALVLGVGAGLAAPPPNDSVASAEVLAGESGSRTGTNVDATNEPNEPNHDGERSVWYRWTAPAAGTFVFETCNASGVPRTTFDTILAVFAESGPRLALSDDACGEQSSVAFLADLGSTYRIVVAGYDDDESGLFTLRWRLVAVAANDAFAAAETLEGPRGSVTGSTLGATLEPGEPAHGPRSTGSVWFAWTSPVTGAIVFETCGSSFDTLLAVYTGTAVTTLTDVGRNDDSCDEGSRVRLSVRSGVTYRIAVAGYEERGDFVLRWLRPPANDDVSNARPVRGQRGALSGSNVGATRETDEPRPSEASIWYRWRAPSATAVAWSTCTTSFDTLLTVYRLAGSGRLQFVARDDDACPRNLGSLLVLHPQRGATYYVGVDGIDGETGTFRLVWGTPPAYAWCRVPDVRGKTLRRATELITAANCALGRVVRVPSSIVPRGVVTSQFPLASGERRRYGTRVRLEVSGGPR